MSEINAGRRASGAINGASALLGPADWLSLAAAPVFAITALLTMAQSGEAADILCSAARGSPLHGMTVMYALMSAFHSPPWLRLFLGRHRRRDPA